MMIFLVIVFSLLALSRAQITFNAQQFVTAHNTYRAAVDPQASNMQPMSWSDELATKAQGYADKCIWGHNPDRTSPLGKVGENLYLTTGTPSDFSVAVASWNNEKAYYNYASSTCQAGKVCGHYTQVVWASTNKVGCGVTRCPTLTGSTAKNALVVVCNYYPAGNVRGQKPYVAARVQEVLDSEDMSDDQYFQNGPDESETSNRLQELYGETGDINYEKNGASEEMNVEEMVAELKSRLRGAKNRHHA